MAEAFWGFNEARQPPILPYVGGKRPRSDLDFSGSHDFSAYYARNDESIATHLLRETDSIGGSYDHYLRNVQLPSYGGESMRPLSGGLTGPVVDDRRVIGVGGMDLMASAKTMGMGPGGGRPEIPLPHDASSTLFVEGLPANSTRREVAHIFRPFVGYKEVRLVTKESRIAGGDPLILCFVDFSSPAHAATALDALQGYQFDESEPGSVILKLQYARHPGPRLGGGYRGKR